MAEATRVVLVTAPDAETGRGIAQALVREHLAACVNVVPGVHSIYRWEGEMEEGEEMLLVIKTRQDRCNALEKRVLELHPYEMPEVLVLSVAGGNRDYLDWVSRESLQ
jgi:periplasmic divalent cation tolerance protein